MTQHWPQRLWLVRHGQSEGNVARDVAHVARHARIKLSARDVDIPLSALGVGQSKALGQWFGKLDIVLKPDVLLASPYIRAMQTAQHFQDAGGGIDDQPICMDERLREKEFGILDGLTTSGVGLHQPEQADFRRILGKFYHRPPGGESWCDVILRLRSLMDTVSLHYGGRRVMIVAHQVVVLCLRYVIENLDEQQILEIDSSADVANCAVTEYRFNPAKGKNGNLVLHSYNDTRHLEQMNAAITHAPDPIIGARG